jgi:hypothetical protein
VVKALASYYAGGVLPSAPIVWTVKSAAAAYAPPGMSNYVFKTHVNREEK